MVQLRGTEVGRPTAKLIKKCELLIFNFNEIGEFDWLTTKNREKMNEKVEKNTFLLHTLAHALDLYLTVKFGHCSMRQSKVRDQNMLTARCLLDAILDF